MLTPTSLSAVFLAPRRLALERLPLPRLTGSEALVRNRCATICGSDLHSYFGRRHSPAPCILGHEMVGEIAELGPDGARDFRGSPLQVGDRITWSMVLSCGACFFCQRGLRQKCERLFKFGHAAFGEQRSPLTGAMAEYCFLPEGASIFRIPPHLSDEVAAPANCATATVAAVIRTAGSLAGLDAAVIGAGMLGQTACAMALESGAARVFAVEPDPARRAQALRFGACEDAPPARGVDVALEFAGTPESVEAGVTMLRIGGRLVMAGAVFPGHRPLQLDGEQLVRRMLRIEGVHNYLPEDLENALAFLARAAERYPFAELVDARYPLSQAAEALEFAETRKVPRVAVQLRECGASSSSSMY